VWSIQKSRRNGGARAGGFPGAETILAQIDGGAPRKRVGLRPQGRAPVREGAPLYRNEADTAPIGSVTSGGFGPSLGGPLAMGYLPVSDAAKGGTVFAEVRGQRLPLRVSDMPFVPHSYKR
jgi:aminomethyltransferase